MEHSKIGIMLKAVVIGCGVLVVSAYLLITYPMFNEGVLKFYGDISGFYPYWYACFVVSIVPILIALRHAWVIVSNIGADQSFCKDNAIRFKKISVLAFIFAGYVFLVEIIFFLIFTKMPFLFISGTVLGLVAIGIGTVALVLAMLIDKATDLQDEQSLTI